MSRRVLGTRGSSILVHVLFHTRRVAGLVARCKLVKKHSWASPREILIRRPEQWPQMIRMQRPNHSR